MLETFKFLFGKRKAKSLVDFEALEKAYLEANADVAEAVAFGTFKSGSEHWLRHGAKEGRAFGSLASTEFFSSKIQSLEARINQLETLLTEHPAFFSRGALNTMFPSPAVSIIMPTWNRASVLSDAITSIQAQRFIDWELIVVDDGSTDDTPQVVDAFLPDKRIRYHRIDHAGQSVARNFGLKAASGELVAYLDSDNLWYPDFLSAMVPAFAADEALDVAYGALISDVHLKDRKILFEQFDRARLLQGNFIAMTTLVHRRKLFEQWGGFDERLSKLEDWDLILKYTQHKPAQAIPVIASRCRVVDKKRVSDTQSLMQGAAFALVRSRWLKEAGP
jgi:hypothetical protein